MRSLLQMTTVFSSTLPTEVTPIPGHPEPTVEGSEESHPEETGIGIDKTPSTLFQASDLGLGGAGANPSATQPSHRRMLRKWNPIGGGRRRNMGIGARTSDRPSATTQDQLLKLQQLASGVDAV